MKIIKYNKLIRDRIPEIIESSDKKALVKKIEGEELLNLLNKKLSEELKEYEESGEVEEFADLVEVVHAILDYKKISVEDFNKISEKKNTLSYNKIKYIKKYVRHTNGRKKFL